MKLIGPKQVVIAGGAMILGLILGGARIYAEHGKFERHHWMAIGATMVLMIVILVAVTRFANRADE